MSATATAVLLVCLDLLGLGALWLYVRSRVSRALELDSLMEELRKEVRALNIELNETADRNISLVEDRMETLRNLLDEADRRMGIMRKEIGNRAAEREVYSALGRPRPERPSPRTEVNAASLFDEPEAQVPVPPRPQAQPQPDDAAEDRRSDEDEAGPIDGSGATPIRLDLPRRMPEVSPARTSVIPQKPLREEAIELYNRGFSAEIIAARLGATVAEIDLLVSLEERRREGEGR